MCPMINPTHRGTIGNRFDQSVRIALTVSEGRLFIITQISHSAIVKIITWNATARQDEMKERVSPFMGNSYKKTPQCSGRDIAERSRRNTGADHPGHGP